MATTKKNTGNTGKMEDKYSRFNDDGYGIRPIKSSGSTGGKKSGGSGKGGKK